VVPLSLHQRLSVCTDEMAQRNAYTSAFKCVLSKYCSIALTMPPRSFMTGVDESRETEAKKDCTE
jgi:hypothetical protein